MSLCNDPYSVSLINEDEYVGASLNTINSNFLNLKTEICRLNDETISLTPDLANLQTGLCALTFNVDFAKAWVNFNGSSSGILNLITTYNVFQVSANGQGTYEITFSNPSPFINNDYALVATCTQNQINNLYTWVQTTTGFTSTSATINVRNTTGTTTTADYISVVVYGN